MYYSYFSCLESRNQKYLCKKFDTKSTADMFAIIECDKYFPKYRNYIIIKSFKYVPSFLVKFYLHYKLSPSISF